MINEIYLHIGSHKTGTSSIQGFLKRHTEALHRNEGLLYYSPKPWPLATVPGTTDFSVRLAGLNALGKIDAEKLVISHENFSWLTSAEDIRSLQIKLRKFCKRPRVLVYLRRQDMLAISQKQEGTKSPDNSVAYGHEIAALPSKLTESARLYLDFETKINKWADAFGKDNVVIRLFEKGGLHEDDSISDFLKCLGVDPQAKYARPPRINESISLSKQIFLHQTREFFAEKSPEKMHLVRAVRNLKLPETEKLLPSRDEALAFYEPFRESNRRLNQKYRISANPCLFSDDFSFYPEVSNARPMDERELNEMYAKAIRTLSMEIDAFKKEEPTLRKNAVMLRDLALATEAENPAAALVLMRKAHEFFPEGQLILRKIAEYESAAGS
jgi:hypothetical protein